jgi:tripartite-type tricarboxylate transporter receptor subunit TctC
MKLPRRKFLHLAAGAAALPAMARSARAQAWPSRNIRMVVPFGAGFGVDVIARIIASRLSELWRVQVIVENRPGSGGNIGSEAVARSQPDGYTLLCNGPALALNRYLFGRLSYDPVNDFAPATLVCTLPNIIIVPNSSPAKSVSEFIRLAKARTVSTFASGGTGTTQHLSGELLKRMAGIDLTHVPYREASFMLTDLFSGRVDAAFTTLSQVIEVVRTNQARGLAVTSAKRFPLAPELPTVSEALPGYDVSTWFAIFVPSKTPMEIIKKISSDTAAALSDPDVRRKLEQVSAVVVGSAPEELAAVLRSDMDKWGGIIKDAGIKLE